MGWLTGAGIGFMLGGPLGAIVGGAMEHILSKGSGPFSAKMDPFGRDPVQRDLPEADSARGEQVFISALVAILTRVCMADGTISDSERKVIHTFFSRELRYKGVELKFIDAMIAETVRRNPDLAALCVDFNQFAKKTERLLLLDLVYRVVVADHTVTAGEKEAIHQIVATLEISEEAHEQIKSCYAAAALDDRYATLGLTPSATPDEIKRAYRQRAVQYHPDKVSHLGPELIAFAEKKFKKINADYEAIRKERGF